MTPSQKPQDGGAAVRYEPHCDCLGGHVSMRPDPNGRWCPTNPRAVADDPSGIVQQMPEGGDEALKPCPFCGEAAKNFSQSQFWLRCSNPECGAELVIRRDKDEAYSAWNRRATEADLRADVERLRGLLWYAWSEFNAIRARSGAPLSNDGMPLITEDWWSTMTEAFGAAIGDDAQTPWPSPEARAALSPETDGGQDE